MVGLLLVTALVVARQQVESGAQVSIIPPCSRRASRRSVSFGGRSGFPRSCRRWAAAAKAYSQVAQWNFNYSDVQQRIKKLRELDDTPGQVEPKFAN